MTTTATGDNGDTRKFPSYSDLASFHIEIYNAAHELQKMRSGLLSSSDAIRTANFVNFTKGVAAIHNSIAHVQLLGGETRSEQIQAMIDYATSVNSIPSSIK